MLEWIQRGKRKGRTLNFILRSYIRASSPHQPSLLAVFSVLIAYGRGKARRRTGLFFYSLRSDSLSSHDAVKAGQSVDGLTIGARNPMAVDIHRNHDRAVSELVLHIRRRFALNQE